MAGVLEGLARGLRSAGGVISPDVNKIIAQDDAAIDAERRQQAILMLQDRMARERQSVDMAARERMELLKLNQPKQFAPPETLQLTEALRQMPENDPRREHLQARLTHLTTRPDKAESTSPLGRLLAEEASIRAENPSDPRLKHYELAIANTSKNAGGGVQITNQMPGLGKPAQGQVDTGLLDTTKGIMTLSTIEGQFRPEFQQIMPRAGAMWSSWKDKAGVGMSPDENKFLQDFSAYKRNAINSMNEYIKSITGAAMSEAEAKRILQGMPRPGEGLFDGDSPTEFKSKLDDAMRQTKMSLARYEYIKRNNIALTDNSGNAIVPLERMPQVMNERGTELEGQFKRANPGMQSAEIQNRVRSVLAKEFGLVK
jgi:hypothetical protein